MYKSWGMDVVVFFLGLLDVKKSKKIGNEKF